MMILKLFLRMYSVENVFRCIWKDETTVTFFISFTNKTNIDLSCFLHFCSFFIHWLLIIYFQWLWLLIYQKYHVIDISWWLNLKIINNNKVTYTFTYHITNIQNHITTNRACVDDSEIKVFFTNTVHWKKTEHLPTYLLLFNFFLYFLGDCHHRRRTSRASTSLISILTITNNHDTIRTTKNNLYTGKLWGKWIIETLVLCNNIVDVILPPLMFSYCIQLEYNVTYFISFSCNMRDFFKIRG